VSYQVLSNISRHIDLKNTFNLNQLKLAGHIIESMDLKTDPCDDFYQFSCGGWMRKNSVPKTEDQKINQFESIDDQITRDVQGNPLKFIKHSL